MSGSSSEERALDPAVVMVAHAGDNGQYGCDSSCEEMWPCLPYRMAKAWGQEYREHTALLERYNALGCEMGDMEDAYAALEQQYLAVSDAHAALVDKVAALAAEAIL